MRKLLFIAVLTANMALHGQQVSANKVELSAKPESVTIDLQRTAVIVVDMQNDFGAKGGMFDRAGIDVDPIRKIVPATANTLAAARAAGVKVLYLKMAFQPDLSDIGPRDAPNYIKHHRMHVGEPNTAPDGTASRILIRDTWDSDIIAELKPVAGDIVMYKHRFSGFHETDLDAALKRLGIKYLIFTGATTSVCVESTMRDAMFLDYNPILLADTTAEPLGHTVDQSNYQASLRVLAALFGWVSDSKEFIRALKRPGR